MLQWNGKLISINRGLAEWHEPPVPDVPTDMDFIYLAKNFDGSKIPNSALNSTFGDYMANGTLTTNGSGASCYLSNANSASNYLYKNLTSTELDNIKAVNGTYTFFIRMMMTNGGSLAGGIMSTRGNGGGYVYMLRCESNQIQFHDYSATNLGTTNFGLNVDRVYKLQISGSYFYAKNLETSATYSRNFGTSRSMGQYMTTFWSGYGTEAMLDRFYGFAGVPRATTESEDEAIKECLMNQSV